MHGLTYLVLTAWFGQLYRARPARVVVALVFVAMCAGLELLQAAGGFRQPSWLDGIANTAGAGCGWLLLKTRLAGSLRWAERHILGV